MLGPKEHSRVIWKILNFDSEWEHPPYKIFDYSGKIYIALNQTLFKQFTDNWPNHNN